MANILTRSFLNPLKFVPIDPNRPDSYLSRHIDDYLFKNTIRSNEQPVAFFAPWINADTIKDQIKSNYGPITLRLYSCDGRLISQHPYEAKQYNIDEPDMYIRQAEIDLSSLEPGIYYCTCAASGVNFEISEPFEVLIDGEGTLAIDFSHYEKRGGMYFQVPFTPRVRIYGALVYSDTDSTDTTYEDQDYDTESLRSESYRIWDFYANDVKGMPPYMIDKIKRIIGCSDLQIDGRYYTKPEDVKWEKTEEPLYPMSGHRLQLRERYNQYEIRTENDIVITGIAAAALTVSNKGFGTSDGAEGYEQIIQLT